MYYCETCVYYPPSSFDGKPCTQCDITNPFLTCYREKEFVVDFQQEHKQTNADHIRTMTDEELSYYLDGLAGDGCPPQMSPVCNKERYKCNVRKCWLEWLKQESEGE